MSVIYNKEAKEEKLYQAYGMTVYGVLNKYRWFIYEDKPDEECITSIRIINENEKELINLGLGNNCIMMENFRNTIDNVLYWINKESPDNYGIEKVIHDSLCQTNSLFNYRIDNLKRKEMENREIRERQMEIRENQDKKNEQLRELCSKKNLFCYINRFDECIILKPLNEKAREILNDSDEKRLKMYIDFACKNPDNTDLKFVFEGSVNDYMGR